MITSFAKVFASNSSPVGCKYLLSECAKTSQLTFKFDMSLSSATGSRVSSSSKNHSQSQATPEAPILRAIPGPLLVSREIISNFFQHLRVRTECPMFCRQSSRLLPSRARICWIFLMRSRSCWGSELDFFELPTICCMWGWLLPGSHVHFWVPH